MRQAVPISAKIFFQINRIETGDRLLWGNIQFSWKVLSGYRNLGKLCLGLNTVDINLYEENCFLKYYWKHFRGTENLSIYLSISVLVFYIPKELYIYIYIFSASYSSFCTTPCSHFLYCESSIQYSLIPLSFHSHVSSEPCIFSIHETMSHEADIRRWNNIYF